MADRLAHQFFELIDVEGFFDVVEGPVPHGFDRRGDRGVGRDHHHFAGVRRCSICDDELQAAHAGHLQVGDDAIVAFRACSDCRASVALEQHCDLVARLAEHVGHRFAGLEVVVDHQHAAAAEADRLGLSEDRCHAAAFQGGCGIRRVKAAPPSGQLAAGPARRGPRRSASTIASPSPVPPDLVV